MKVTMPKKDTLTGRSYRDYFTLSDVDRAKMVIEYEKDDDYTIKEWAEYAIQEAGKGAEIIFEASAEVARNGRIYNAYTENSGDMDVWITATAKTYDGFIEIGAYLSDIWQTGAVEYKQHMYIQTYSKDRF